MTPQERASILLAIWQQLRDLAPAERLKAMADAIDELPEMEAA